MRDLRVRDAGAGEIDPGSPRHQPEEERSLFSNDSSALDTPPDTCWIGDKFFSRALAEFTEGKKKKKL